MESYRTKNLPEELVLMLRLPVKDLFVCKCVCKDWCALIKRPSFVNGHLNRESNQECLIFLLGRDADDPSANEYPFVKYQDNEMFSLIEEPYYLRKMLTYICPVGLEKGIFCVMSPGNYRLCLLNPATRESKTLPPHPLHAMLFPPGPFYPLADFPNVGFGLDPSSEDFKVVMLTTYKLCKLAFVYNLSSNSWKTIETIDLLDKIVICHPMCNQGLNGVKHWLVKSDDHGVSSILTFDMRSEKFQVIAIPDALGQTERSLRITAYCDSVAVMSYECNGCVDLWVMGRHGLWSKSFSIDPFKENVSPLCVWNKNEVFFKESVWPIFTVDCV